MTARPCPETAPAARPAELSVADAEADEGGTLSFAVTLSAAADEAVTVDYATTDGTAVAGEDYRAASGTLSFAAGETSKTVEVEAHADRAAEDDETFALALSNASGAVIGDGEATGTVADVAPPAAVSGVAVVSDPGADGTYGLGDLVRIEATFDAAVDVTGSPRLTIDMDPADWGAKWAAYESGGDTATLSFAYEVVEPNESTEGIAVLANTLEANGGAIRSAETEADAELAHAGLGHDPAHQVDWRPAVATVTGVSVASDAGADATYRLGDVIRIRVGFSEAVDVTGSPRLTIDMDPADWGAKWGGVRERRRHGVAELRPRGGRAEPLDRGHRGAGGHAGGERRRDPDGGDGGGRGVGA